MADFVTRRWGWGVDSIITWELGSYVEKVDGFCLSHYVRQLYNLWGKKFPIDSAVKEKNEVDEVSSDVETTSGVNNH